MSDGLEVLPVILDPDFNTLLGRVRQLEATERDLKNRIERLERVVRAVESRTNLLGLEPERRFDFVEIERQVDPKFVP